MSDIFGKISGLKNAAGRICRVAYTLNNAQPVTCTIIDDQPLFYMDFDGSFTDDEELYDAAELGILESEIRSLKEQIEVYDKFSYEFSRDSEKRMEEFLSNSDTVTAPFEKQKAKNVLEEVVETLTQSRLAKAYLDFAREQKVEIRLSAQVERAFYDRRAALILVNPHFDHCEMVLLCVRELRHHWQHRQGALIHPLTFQPDSAVLVNRAQIADLTVSMIRCAWEMQLSGVKAVWERIENSPLADLGRAFAREAYLDFRTINNGMASAAVFETWFLSERCQQEDKKLVQQMLADYQGYVFEDEQAGQALTPGLISALGNMPYGKNYLAQHAQTILNDPIFTDVRDRSNANFLWFIKFERSFKETEQELQTESDFFAPGDRSGEPPLKDFDNVTQQNAQIITLYGSSAERKQKPSKTGTKGKTSADIVYLRYFPGDPQN